MPSAYTRPSAASTSARIRWWQPGVPGRCTPAAWRSGWGSTRSSCPRRAGVGSAFGLLLAPILFDFVRTYVVRLEDLDIDELGNLLRALEAEGRGIVEAAGVAAADIEVRRSADMRYVGQGFEIRVELPDVPFDERMASRIEEAFETEYQRLYGRLCAGVPIESVHWRVAVSGPRPRAGARRDSPGPVRWQGRGFEGSPRGRFCCG